MTIKKDRDRQRIFFVILVLVFVFIALALLVLAVIPRPPVPVIQTMTAIESTSTATGVPKATVTLTPEITPTVPGLVWEPTITIATPTTAPTEVSATPQPEKFVVTTGYQDGWLHFRDAPLPGGYPMWPDYGALREGTQVYPLLCVRTPYLWVLVSDGKRDGWVYAPFVKPDICK